MRQPEEMSHFTQENESYLDLEEPQFGDLPGYTDVHLPAAIFESTNVWSTTSVSEVNVMPEITMEPDPTILQDTAAAPDVTVVSDSSAKPYETALGNFTIVQHVASGRDVTILEATVNQDNTAVLDSTSVPYSKSEEEVFSALRLPRVLLPPWCLDLGPDGDALAVADIWRGFKLLIPKE